MSAAASIGVLIPTRNCASLLPGHADSLKAWLDLAAEVVVVDSESTDGTVEYLREHLRHPRVHFFQHPRGLYQSWNFGIRQLTAKYAYIATVGDAITRAGVEQLHSLAEKYACDVVTSKPRLIDDQDRALPISQWPIDDVLQYFPGQQPVVLEGLGLFLFAIANYTGAILGSSASNLYRSEILRQHPFPIDYGTVGDGAWGLMNGWKVRVAFSGEIFSTFREHPKAYAASEYAVSSLNDKLIALAGKTFRDGVGATSELQVYAAALRLKEVIQAVTEQEAAQKQLEKSRHSKRPWILSVSAWAARINRSRQAKRLADLKSAAIVEIKRRGLTSTDLPFQANV